ncbi:LytTR family DNA-binding domain-containing protein [Maribellus sp. YY47]|uniref:LytR/AlgR family response regulator transcription factor n=1 Tax=Maribellus sp. YY47 TaxID=2929486 RepID=UPI002001D859|nr:LytTR family DNA-binding domain-containing protein [Maribellus sp. YY47]MCK3684158.1 LytTR family DNA-binding domain-containing protein [Maribellus sp. YY47]
MQLNCLIIDDEPLSQDVLTDFANLCPELNLIGVCKDALEAGQALSEQKVDLLFLDINMPKLSGINFVKSLKETPLFILVTAYPEYALEGFEIDAVDYLLKPVAFERFRMAVNRAVERYSSSRDNNLPTHIMLRADRKDYRIELNDILYLEAQGDYVRFVTGKQNLTVHGTLKEFIEELPAAGFERIHKSYVIALKKVEYLEGNMVKLGEFKLPVSLHFRENLMAKLKS